MLPYPGREGFRRGVRIPPERRFAAVVQVSAAPVCDRQGEIIAGVATYRDVTDRQQREREIQRLASFPN